MKVRDRRRLRQGVALVAGITVIAGLDVSMLRSTASAKTDFDVVNSTVNAGADYVVYFTGVFSNFSPGLVGSTFPLAHTHIDNSPFAEATASPADTGPAGGLAVSAYNTSPAPSPAPQTVSQPQYAESKYPPGSPKASTTGSPGGAYASALANATSATASATASNSATQPGSAPAAQSPATAPSSSHITALAGGPVTDVSAPPAAVAGDPRAAEINAFNAAMTAWRARFLSPAVAAQYPMQPASTTTPDGTDGDTSSSSTVIDPDKGLIATGDARVQKASFGGGALVFHSIHTAVTITNAGSPKADVTVNPGDSTVGGIPVSIGANGITVASGTVPLDGAQTASAQLNQVLAAAGITVGTVNPVVKTFPNRETVSATAVTVTEDQPGPPEQKVRHDLGHVEAEDLAVPAQPAAAAVAAPAAPPAAPAAGAHTTTTTPVTTTFIPGTAGTPGTPASPVTPPSAARPGAAAPAAGPGQVPLAPALVSVKSKPLWLLLLYLAWQALMIGAGASLWWSRGAAARAAAAAASR